MGRNVVHSVNNASAYPYQSPGWTLPPAAEVTIRVPQMEDKSCQITPDHDNVSSVITDHQQDGQLVNNIAAVDEATVVNVPAPCAASQREPASDASSIVGYSYLSAATNSIPPPVVNVSSTVTDETEDVVNDKFASCQSEANSYA